MASSVGSKLSLKMASEMIKEVFNEDTFNKFREDGVFCDINLMVEGKGFPCHKVVLAARCDYFFSMFSGNFIESQKETVSIEGVTASVSDQVLKYIYCQEVFINMSNVFELLDASNLLLLDELKRRCAKFLEDRLTEVDLVVVTQKAQLYGLENLLKACVELVVTRFSDFQNVYLSLPCELAYKVLSCKMLVVSSEREVAEAAMKWLKVHAEHSSSDVEKIMSAVRITECDPLFVKSVLMETDAIKNSGKVMSMLANYCSQVCYDLFVPREVHIQFPRPSTGLQCEVRVT